MRICIAGAGDVGIHLAQILSKTKTDVILLEKQSVLCEELKEKIDATVINGCTLSIDDINSTSPGTLDIFLAVTGDDSTNIVASATAKRLGAAKCIARVDSPDFYQSNEFGLYEVYGTDFIVSAAHLISRDVVCKMLSVEFNYVQPFLGYSTVVCQFEIEPGSKLIGSKITDLDVYSHQLLKGVVRNHSFRDLNSVLSLQEQDQIVLCSTLQELLPVLADLRPSVKKSKTIIIGGGDIGLQIASLVKFYTKNVEIIEQDESTALAIAEKYDEIRVVRGSGTDISFLKELSLNDRDYFISVTGSDESNLMSALVSQTLGVKNSVTRLNKSAYRDIYNHLGLIQTTSPHQVMLSYISSKIYNDIKDSRKHELGGYKYLQFQIPKLGMESLKAGQICYKSIAYPMALLRKGQSIPFSMETSLRSFDLFLLAVPNSSVRSISASFKKLIKEKRV